MYYDKKEDRIRTMITGTPLTAEDIRVKDDGIGSGYGGTSWFFTMHLIAKSLTRKSQDEINFDSLHTTVSNYHIHDWTNRPKLEQIEQKWISAFNKCNLGNMHIDDDNNIIIDGTISKNEFKNFADSQYDFAMTNGLTSYSHLWGGFQSREKSHFIERILWHYITSVYDGPQVLSDPSEGSFLDGLFVDFTETMDKANIEIRGVPIWKKVNYEGGLDFLQGWERSFIEKNILNPITIGDTTYIAPSFFANVDMGVFKDINSSEVMDFISDIRKIPAYPISKGNRKLYDLAKNLQLAGAIKIVEDSGQRTIGKPTYVYLVSRDRFEQIDRGLNYSYSSNSLSDWGDSSITDQFFAALGRINLYGYSMTPGSKILASDNHYKLDEVIKNLEEKHYADISHIPQTLLDPLKTLNIIKQDDNILTVNGENCEFIEPLSDCWNQLLNEPSLGEIAFPSAESIKLKGEEQSKIQIKKQTDKYYL